jgi:hypothetical protein
MTVPARGLADVSPHNLQMLSFLAGSSAIPIRTPSSKVTQQLADCVFARRVFQGPPVLSDAAALGLVIVTPGDVYNHAPVDFVETDSHPHFEGDAWNHSQAAGFPLGEPL